MILSEYISNLQEILKDHGDIEVVYSSDSEGNSFHRVGHKPSIGTFYEEDQEFLSQEENTDAINAVCVN